MSTRFFVAGLAIALVVSVPAISAEATTGTYVLATTPFIGVVCSPDCLDVQGANLGGYQFDGNALTPLSVSIQDASGGAVSFTVCQDWNHDGFCGDMGEPRVDGCSDVADLSTSTIPFVANVQTSVFVTIAEPGCGGTATSGTITLVRG